jgi:hypothetical protein
MDLSSPVISLLIVCYGAYEYQRREKAQREAMELLRRGEVPSPAGSKPRPWRLLTTGSVCVLLAGFVSLLFYAGAAWRRNSARPLEIMASLIAVPLAILVMIFVRDLRRYIMSQHNGKESGR